MAIEPNGASSSGPNGYSRGSDAGYDGDDYEYEDEYENEPIDFSDIEQRLVAGEVLFHVPCCADCALMPLCCFRYAVHQEDP